MTARNQNPTPTAEKRAFMTCSLGGITLGWQEALSFIGTGGAAYATIYVLEKGKEQSVKRDAQISTAFIVTDAHSPIEPRVDDPANLVAEQAIKVDHAKQNFNKHISSDGTVALSMIFAVAGAALCNRLLRQDRSAFPGFVLR